MTTRLQDLIDQRATAWTEAQGFLQRHRDGDEMSAEDDASWARALADVDTLATQIENISRSEDFESRFAELDEAEAQRARELAQGGPTSEEAAREAEFRSAFDAYIRHGREGLDTEQRQLMARAQTTTVGSSGGYTVPTGFWQKVTETMVSYARVMEDAEVITTSAGNQMTWPTVDDSGNSGELLAENASATSQDVTFGQATLDSYIFSSKLILAPISFMQDSATDPDAYLTRRLAERLGRAINSYYTVGTGTSQPQGFVTGATTGKTTSSATAIAFTELIDLIHSVDVAYRDGGSCKFYMHDLILAYVRKLLDGNNRPLWQPSVIPGTPDTLLGYPVQVNNFMASTVATTNKTAAFGDMRSAFVIRNVAGGQLMRLDERYAEAFQVGFLGFLRTDSVVQDASAVKLLVQA